MEKKPKAQVDKTKCEKCKGKSVVYNRNKYLCYPCFEEIINHKFRSNLRTVCKIRHEDNILVCVSGDTSSMAMVHLLDKSFNDSKSQKKMFFKVKFLYIADSIDSVKRQEDISLITSAIQSAKFSYDVVNIESCMNNDIEKFKLIYNLVPSKGGFRKKFMQIIKQNLIFDYAIKNSFTKIVYASNGQEIVNNIFALLAIGKGDSIKHSSDYVDSSFLNGKISILKPMKDFFNKEISYYNHFNKINVIYPNTDEDNNDIILNKFFEGLQNSKINTVPSVLNTTEKVHFNPEEEKNKKRCLFCLDVLNKPITSLEIDTKSSETADMMIKDSKLCYGCVRMFENIDKDNYNIITTIFSSLLN